MTDYTPTTEEVEESFISQQYDVNESFESAEETGRAFDRWLKQHDREVAARALEETANDLFDTAIDTEVADWLRARAWRIRNGEINP